jgi:hypothetical protein
MVGVNMVSSCWVLTEGIAGTENQCRALAEALGLNPVIKRAKPKAPWCWLPADLVRPRLGALAQGSDRLAPPWPELLIAGGHKCVGLALAIRRASGGATFAVCVQNPHIAPALFDLVIVPAHDRVAGPNVIVTEGAPNRVTEARLTEGAARVGPMLAHLPRPLLTVLIGGRNRRHRFAPEEAAKLGAALTKCARAQSLGLALTVSRRTAPESAAVLKAALGPTPMVFDDGSGENPFFGYLALADAILVTGDSVSMISEACTTNKPVYFWPLKERPSPRFLAFYERLEEAGRLRRFDGRIDAWQAKPLNDTAEAVAVLAGRLKAWRARGSG